MSKGISLHIGLNAFDSEHYGWNGTLNACELDALDMQTIAAKEGFHTNLLLTSEAKYQNVIRIILVAADKLENGDIFQISFSGHGGRLPDINGDENDFTDETWCLYDRQIIDDELSVLWSRFNQGVRILIISDSCHSGTVSKFADRFDESKLVGQEKRLTRSQSKLAYTRNKILYDEVLQNHEIVERETLTSSVLLISGCQDSQTSLDGDFNGVFTAALKRAWRNGKFDGNYNDFHATIRELLIFEDQDPNILVFGRGASNFVNEKPFNI